jgi:steroid delta-isomerase-like uncharacterized protein
MMTPEENKALVHRFFEEVFNKQDQRAAAEIIAPAFVAHHPAFPDGIRGPEGIMQMQGMFHTAFPDLQYSPLDLIADGDKVAVRWSASGTHRGPFQGFPATGKAVTIMGIDIFRFGAKQMEEAWVNSDFLGLMQQLGMIPPQG